MDELERMLAAAQRALGAGADSSAVNAHIAKLTGGRFSDIAALSQAASLNSASEPEQRPGLFGRIRDNVREGLSEARDVGRMALHGATLSFSDELAGAAAAVVPGGRGYREARDASRENMDRIRSEMPAAAFGAELLGGIATPGFGAGGAVARGATAGAKVVRGAAAGAAGGAVASAGHADELEDVPGAVRTGLLAGAVLGGGVAGIGAGLQAGARFVRDPLRGNAAEAGTELAGRMRRGADVTGEVAPVRAAATQRAKAAFADLDNLTELDSPAIREVLSDGNVARLAGIPEDVASGARAPSFSEAQKAHQRIRKLRDRAQNAADMDSFQKAAEMEQRLFSALDDATEGAYSRALPEYAAEMANVRHLRSGWQLASKSADEVESAYSALDGDAAMALREGLASRFVQRLEDGAGVETFVRRAESSPQMRRKLAVVFGGDEQALQSFLEDVSRTRPGSRAEFLKKLRDRAGLFAAGAAGAGTGLSIFR